MSTDRNIVNVSQAHAKRSSASPPKRKQDSGHGNRPQSNTLNDMIFPTKNIFFGPPSHETSLPRPESDMTVTIDNVQEKQKANVFTVDSILDMADHFKEVINNQLNNYVLHNKHKLEREHSLEKQEPQTRTTAPNKTRPSDIKEDYLSDDTSSSQSSRRYYSTDDASSDSEYTNESFVSRDGARGDEGDLISMFPCF